MFHEDHGNVHVLQLSHGLPAYKPSYLPSYFSFTVSFYDTDLALGFYTPQAWCGPRECKSSIKTTCSWIFKSLEVAAVAALPVGEIAGVSSVYSFSCMLKPHQEACTGWAKDKLKPCSSRQLPYHKIKLSRVSGSKRQIFIEGIPLQRHKGAKTTWKHNSMEMRYCFLEGSQLLEAISIPIQVCNTRYSWDDRCTSCTSARSL